MSSDDQSTNKYPQFPHKFCHFPVLLPIFGSFSQLAQSKPLLANLLVQTIYKTTITSWPDLGTMKVGSQKCQEVSGGVMSDGPLGAGDAGMGNN